jgi:hypothetical protein
MTTSNETRAQRAEQALYSYLEAKCYAFEQDDTEAHITDLIADLLHMAARNLADDSKDESLDVDAVADRMLRVARLHFDAEHGNPEEEGAAAERTGDE